MEYIAISIIIKVDWWRVDSRFKSAVNRQWRFGPCNSYSCEWKWRNILKFSYTLLFRSIASKHSESQLIVHNLFQSKQFNRMCWLMQLARCFSAPLTITFRHFSRSLEFWQSNMSKFGGKWSHSKMSDKWSKWLKILLSDFFSGPCS